jgi:hypothetical protein
MFNGWFKLHKIDVDPNESPESFFPKIVDGYASIVALPFKAFPSSFRQKIEEEARPYIIRQVPADLHMGWEMCVLIQRCSTLQPIAGKSTTNYLHFMATYR